MLNIFSNQSVGMKKITDLEAKIQEKDQVIESLVRNGADLKEKMQKIEDSRESLEGLLERVLELEGKLSERKKEA